MQQWDSCNSDNGQFACSLGKYLNFSNNFMLRVLVFHGPSVFNQSVIMAALTAETMLLAAGSATHFARSGHRSSTSCPLSGSVTAVGCNTLQF